MVGPDTVSVLLWCGKGRRDHDEAMSNFEKKVTE